MSTVKDYIPTQDTQNVVNKFLSADQKYQAAWAEFYDRHQQEIDQLDQLREERNVNLDEAGKMLRSEATRLDPTRYKTFKFGPFQVSKKFGSDSFRAVEFVNLAKSLGFKKQMEDEGAIATKIEINQEAANEFLKKNGLEKQFATTIEPGLAMTPAVSGPKPIPAFGQELKAGK